MLPLAADVITIHLSGTPTSATVEAFAVAETAGFDSTAGLPFVAASACSSTAAAPTVSSVSTTNVNDFVFAFGGAYTAAAETVGTIGGTTAVAISVSSAQVWAEYLRRTTAIASSTCTFATTTTYWGMLCDAMTPSGTYTLYKGTTLTPLTKQKPSITSSASLALSPLVNQIISIKESISTSLQASLSATLLVIYTEIFNPIISLTVSVNQGLSHALGVPTTTVSSIGPTSVSAATCDVGGGVGCTSFGYQHKSFYDTSTGLYWMFWAYTTTAGLDCATSSDGVTWSSTTDLQQFPTGTSHSYAFDVYHVDTTGRMTYALADHNSGSFSNYGFWYGAGTLSSSGCASISWDTSPKYSGINVASSGSPSEMSITQDPSGNTWVVFSQSPPLILKCPAADDCTQSSSWSQSIQVASGLHLGQIIVGSDSNHLWALFGAGSSISTGFSGTSTSVLDMYYSTDGGSSWYGPYATTGVSYYETTANMISIGNTAYVTMSDGTHAYFATFTTSWGTENQITSAYGSVLDATSSGTMYMLTQNFTDISYMVSSNGGTTWSGPTTLIANAFQYGDEGLMLTSPSAYETTSNKFPTLYSVDDFHVGFGAMILSTSGGLGLFLSAILNQGIGIIQSITTYLVASLSAILGVAYSEMLSVMTSLSPSIGIDLSYIMATIISISSTLNQGLTVIEATTTNLTASLSAVLFPTYTEILLVITSLSPSIEVGLSNVAAALISLHSTINQGIAIVSSTAISLLASVSGTLSGSFSVVFNVIISLTPKLTIGGVINQILDNPAPFIIFLGIFIVLGFFVWKRHHNSLYASFD